MEPAEQAVLAVAGVSVTVILGALLAIARRDRLLAGDRTSARAIDAAIAAPATLPASAAPAPAAPAPAQPAPAPPVPDAVIPAPQTPAAQAPVGAFAVPASTRSRRLRLGRRAGT